ncbi:DNA repair protein [Holdemanella biformis]|uniref:Y-family DNA polymerase n=1 Tax=Holdemanella biformis TaxID=1735 RepID=UPI0022E73D82|nr:DNA repair protein [Holdemanella biformis]
MQKTYLCIDLKSFYASVECVELGLDPFKVNLVVADPTRGGGAITLAATPAIKKLGVSSRGRIFEIDPKIEYMITPPRMHLYMEYSCRVYKIFLEFIAKEDIHVYSIDESFLDVTSYLKLYQVNAKELAKKILDRIYEKTGLIATVGIGTNLYLAKIAMDVSAKHNADRIAYLNEDLYRQTLWHHTPMTDFWMLGNGTERRLHKLGIYDMYDLSQFPIEILYKEFGVNAEYIIDHAWGKEPTTIQDIKNYKSKQHSISNSQILFEDYSYKNAFVVMKEMVDQNVLTLTEKHLVTKQISLMIGYSKDCIKPSCGSCKITNCTNSYSILLEEFKRLYIRIVNPNYPIRQIAISFQDVKDEYYYENYDLFTDVEKLEREKKLQETLVQIKHRYGKNAILKGMNALDFATAKKRNTLIGGHNAY